MSINPRMGPPAAAALLFLPLSALAAGVPGKVEEGDAQLSEVTIIGTRAPALSSADLSKRGYRACRATGKTGPCCAPARCSKLSRGSSSRSTVVTARPTSSSCAASTWTTARTSHRASTACRSTCPRTDMGRVTATSTSLIPELVDRIEYKKGTYYADEGNFSAAGAVDVTYARRLDRSLLAISAGENSFRRTLLAVSPQWGDSDLLAAIDYHTTTGPGNSRRVSGA